MTTHQYASPLADDLAAVLVGSEALWRELNGVHVLVTGGTGFVGCWLLEAALWARARFRIDLRISVLARRPERLAAIAPHLAADPAITLVRGDIRNGDLPSHDGQAGDGRRVPYTHVIHAATATNVSLDNPPPLAAFDASVMGTRHVLDLCERHAVKRFLLISSGAVYGRTHALDRPLTESDPLASVRGDLAGAYALGKAAAEFLSVASGAAHGFTAVAARCFSFIGPYQPFNSGFAAGNFMRDALEGKSIQIKGDGTPIRSYLYGADMAMWLWTMLLRGEHGEIFNVGSDRPISIGELARQIAREVPAAVPVRECPVVVAGQPTGHRPELFAPDVGLARARLGLDVVTPLDAAIRRTAAWAATAGAANQATLCAPPCYEPAERT
ncbi:NAD-dependent epimerase/dehydratase family protein [Paraburkholderia phymatum]|uniref:NAD-dependent epimerase/dehydratase family protein n=1 Tax=Paraburkholderia phymatum TaxID=148447 RepID=A0ACC6U8X1_9BURK